MLMAWGQARVAINAFVFSTVISKQQQAGHFVLFETGPYCVALAVQELAVLSRLTLNS